MRLSLKGTYTKVNQHGTIFCGSKICRYDYPVSYLRPDQPRLGLSLSACCRLLGFCPTLNYSIYEPMEIAERITQQWNHRDQLLMEIPRWK